MDIVINTEYEGAGPKVWVHDLRPKLEAFGHTVTRNDWDSYEKYDAALFMAPDSAVRTAKEQQPDIITVLMDPKLNLDTADARAANLLVVSSIEQKDRFLSYNDNILIYPPYPEYQYQTNVSANHTGDIVIGYHGNKLHLHQFGSSVTPALEALGERYDIELLAIYNIDAHGIWRTNVPNSVDVTHIQWSPSVYSQHLARSDIGIVNDLLPMNNLLSHLGTQHLSIDLVAGMDNLIGSAARFVFGRKYGYDNNDYLMRFKYTCNSGRIYPFSQLEIPVVASATPSNGQVITHGESGFLATSEAGWHHYLKELIEDVDLRKKVASNLRSKIDTTRSPDKSARLLEERLINLV